MNTPLAAQRFELTYKAAHLQCLDKDGAPIIGADASGFVRREGGELYLYTCWHVVTGLDVHGLNTGEVSPQRMALSVTLQDTQTYGAGAIGNRRRLQVPLYDSSGHPLWSQDKKDDPQTGLPAAKFRVPFFHDAVKLRLASDARVSNFQVIEEECFLGEHTVMPGDKALLVGYPRGYGVLGSGRAIPVVLTRFIAASKIMGRKYELLLDGLGTPGMSGGPVFIERDASIYLLGLYTGSISPNRVDGDNEIIAALGACCDMTICWKRMPLQPYTVLD